jgi:riboflavin synthase
MFTGIIEQIGTITAINTSGTNRTFQVRSALSSELKIDQSISHNGICLTVEAVAQDTHQVTAIAETLAKTTAGSWNTGDLVNLERCMAFNGRVDGHLVQGHVDTTAICSDLQERNGSWEYQFAYDPKFASLLVEKGSVCINGTSLTVFDLEDHRFRVAIIPYTYHHTQLHKLQPGSNVNIEFDMIGKYVQRMHHLSTNKN